MSSRSFVPITTLSALVAGALLAPAAAEPILYAPFANGLFLAGPAGWRLGPGTAIADNDYDGEMEAVLFGVAEGDRLATEFSQFPAAADHWLTFTLDRGTILGVSVRASMVDARVGAPEVPTDFLMVMTWEVGEFGEGRHFLDPAQASTPIAGWETMSDGERRATLAGFVYSGLSFEAREATHPFGSLVDNFAVVLDSPRAD